MRRTSCVFALFACVLAVLPARATEIEIGTAGPDCSTAATASLPFYCENLKIPVNTDGARLDATFYIPKAASDLEPVPAVLMTHGYGGWHRSAGDLASQAMLASNGYAVLAYTSRGFGRSAGAVQLESPEGEVRDAIDLISWLAEPGNTGARVLMDAPGDPRVGMYGGSYAGGIQLLTAAQDPGNRLDAITPQITWNDLRYALSPNGVTHHGWIDLLYASGKYSGHLGPLGGAPVVVSTDGVPIDQDIQILTSFATNDNFEMPVPYSDGTYSSYEYLARRSVAGDVADITTPTFLIQGQNDTLFTVNEAMRNFNGLGADQKKLLVFSGGHGYKDLDGERALINDRILAWFDRYLNGNEDSDTGPQVETWRPWVDGANFAAATPATSLTPAELGGPPSATIVNIVAPSATSETTNFQQTTNLPAEEYLPGIADASWEEIPSTTGDGTYLFGIPRVRFHITAVAPEAIVFVKLWDAGGEEWQLIHRLVSPVRVRGSAGDFCGGYLPPELDPTASVDADVCLDLSGITYKAAGPLAISIGTTNLTHFGSRIPGAYEISDVSLELPIVPAF